LETKYKVLSLFFDDLKRFKGDAAVAMVAVAPALRNDWVAPGGSVPFLQQLRERLLFLGFFLAESMIPFTVEHVGTLWGLCVRHPSALTDQERDVVLEVSLGIGSRGAFGLETALVCVGMGVIVCFVLGWD
jgi:hypothetical protein